jgi:hypothetical protein
MKIVEDDETIEVMQYEFFDPKEMEIANEAIELEIIGICYLVCDYDTCDCICDDYYGGFFWSSNESSGIAFESILDAKCFIKENDLVHRVYIQTSYRYDEDNFAYDFELLVPLIRKNKINNIINS